MKIRPSGLIRILLFLAGALILLAILIIKPVDQEIYSPGSKIYQQQLSIIDSTKLDTHTSTSLKVGWSRVNITPDFPIAIISYRQRKAYHNVHDSLYIKTFAFDDGTQKAYFVVADLLIFPPEVVNKLRNKLGEDQVNKIYFSATHTHNAPGGWLKSPLARLIAGPYNDGYTETLASAVVGSIKKAEATMASAKISYGEAVAGLYVCNRVDEKDGEDSKVRYTIIEKSTGSRAILYTFAAHANCLSSKEDYFSGDYPAIVSNALENVDFDFAAYASGAVGSMASDCRGRKNYECLNFVGNGVADNIIASLSNSHGEKTSSIYQGKIPLVLEGPSPLLSTKLAIRPWIFEALIGKPNPTINYLKIGDILFLGMPCDFSGPIAKKYNATQADSKIVFTSFNGEYIGYITPNAYQEISHSETRGMNWYGINSGRFFETIIDSLVTKLD